MEQKRFLNGCHLKLIACGAMLVDHACKSVVPRTTATEILTGTIGRIAFPIFAYLLLEGFLHTRSRKKYALNLLIIALISEIPFNLVLHGRIIYLASRNTCFTLLLGLLFLILLEKCEQANKPLLMIVVTAGFAAAFWFANVDYGLAACFVFLVCYLSRYQAPWFTGLLIGTVLLAAYQEPGVYLCLIPLFFYSRTRGRVPQNDPVFT